MAEPQSYKQLNDNYPGDATLPGPWSPQIVVLPGVAYTGTLLLRKRPSVETPLTSYPGFNGWYSFYDYKAYGGWSNFTGGLQNLYGQAYYDSGFDFAASVHCLGWFDKDGNEMIPGKVVFERITSYSTTTVNHVGKPDLVYYVDYKNFTSNEVVVEMEFGIESQLPPHWVIHQMADGGLIDVTVPWPGDGKSGSPGGEKRRQYVVEQDKWFKIATVGYHQWDTSYRAPLVSYTGSGAMNIIKLKNRISGRVSDLGNSGKGIDGGFKVFNAKINDIYVFLREIVAPKSGKGIKCVEPFKNYKDIAQITIPNKLLKMTTETDLFNWANMWHKDNGPSMFGKNLNGYTRHKIKLDGGKAYYVEASGTTELQVQWLVNPGRMEPDKHYYLTVQPKLHPIDRAKASKKLKDDTVQEVDGYYGIERIWPIHYKIDKYWLCENYDTGGKKQGSLPYPICGDWNNGNYRTNKRFTPGSPDDGGWTGTKYTKFQETLDKLATDAKYSDNDSKIDYKEFYTHGYNITSYTEVKNDPDTTKWTKKDLIDQKAEHFAWFRMPTQEKKAPPTKLTLPKNKQYKPIIKNEGALLTQTDNTGLNYKAKLKGSFKYETLDFYSADEFRNADNAFLLTNTLVSEVNKLVGQIKRPSDLPITCGFQYKTLDSNVWKTVTSKVDLNTLPLEDYLMFIPDRDEPGALTSGAAIFPIKTGSADPNRKVTFEFELDIKLNQPSEYRIWVSTVGEVRYFADPNKIEGVNYPPNRYPITVGDVALPGFVGPNTNTNGQWWQIFESWKLYNKEDLPNLFVAWQNNTKRNKFYPVMAVKPSGTSPTFNESTGPHYVYYYLNRTFFAGKNYQFRVVTNGYYDGMIGVEPNTPPGAPVYRNRYDSDAPDLGMITPWGERIDKDNGFGVPYLPSRLIQPGDNKENQAAELTFNLYVHSNVNSYIKTKYKPQKPIKQIISTTNPQNPVSFFANVNFSNSKACGLAYFGIYENEWTFQGYATFNVNNQVKDNGIVKPINTEAIPYLDPASGEYFAGKGWHYLNDYHRLFWFDKVGTNIPLTKNVPYDAEINKNLPAGGNVADYMSGKKVSPEYLVNNFAAYFVPYQRFNLSFDYLNMSSFGITMYLGGQLPYRRSETEWYITNIDELIQKGYVTELARLDDLIPPGSTRNVDFVGLEGNQYLFFVADPILEFHDTAGNKNLNNLSGTEKLINTKPGPGGYKFTNSGKGYGTYSMISLSNFKFIAAYSQNNNQVFNTTNDWNANLADTTYSIRLGVSNNLIPNSPNTEVTIRSKAGNGSFNSGIWENGAWDNGWRDDYTVREFYKVDNFHSTDRSSVWMLRLRGQKSSTTAFAIGDKVSISNIALIDINEERRLFKKTYKVVDYTDDYIDVTFEYDFPIYSIEVDSPEHRILVSRNVWLRGVFFNGYFRGIWNDGIFSGYPLITKMDESHWIDGIFDGGHFTARKHTLTFFEISLASFNNQPRTSLSFTRPHGLAIDDVISVTYSSPEYIGTLGTTVVLDVPDENTIVTAIVWNEDFDLFEEGSVYTTVSTGLIQNFDFYSNNASKVTSLDSMLTESVFSYNSWIDVNYTRQSAVNIGRPESYNEQASDRSYSENNLFGYPTMDVVTSKSIFRDSFSTNSRRYKLGVRYKIFSDYVGDVSDFKDDFQSTDTPLGLEKFNEQGWSYDVIPQQKVSVSTFDQYYESGDNPTPFVKFLHFSFIDSTIGNDFEIGDYVEISGPFIHRVTRNEKQSQITPPYTKLVPVVTTERKIFTAMTFIQDLYYTTTQDGRKLTTMQFSQMQYINESGSNETYLKEETRYDVESTDFEFSIKKTLNNGLTFSRTTESTSTAVTNLLGKELKADALELGGVLNLSPAYDVTNRTNGDDLDTLPKFRYSMVEFDVVRFDYATASKTPDYIDETLGNLPPLHFNNLNVVSRESNYNGIKSTSKQVASYLPVYKNINHLATFGTKKQEFFFNKRNLLMNLTGIGEYGETPATFYLDNIKLYEVDMVPFFKYFIGSNINRSALIPKSTETYGKSPIIDYSLNEQTNEDEVLSFFNGLIKSEFTIPERVNWEADYTIYRVQENEMFSLNDLYLSNVNMAIDSAAKSISTAATETEINFEDASQYVDANRSSADWKTSGINWSPNLYLGKP